MKEKWVDDGTRKPYEPDPENAWIIGGHYVVCRDGKVFGVYKGGRLKEQKPRKHTGGYMRCTMFQKDVYIHRIVAELFCDNPNGYTEVNHVNGNKADNRSDNLEWVTRNENMKHAYDTGLVSHEQVTKAGKAGGKVTGDRNRKLSDDQVREIRRSKESESSLSKMYGVNRSTIGAVRRNERFKEVK